MKNVGIIVTGSRTLADADRAEKARIGVERKLAGWIEGILTMPSVYGENPRIFVITGDAQGADKFARDYFEKNDKIYARMVYRLDGICETSTRERVVQKRWIAASMMEKGTRFPLVRNTVMIARSLMMDRLAFAAFKDPKSKSGGTDQTVRAASAMLVPGETFVFNAENGGFSESG